MHPRLYLIMVSLLGLMACALVEPRGLSDWHLEQRKNFGRDVGGSD